MINVEVTKSENESTSGLIRRFSRQIQDSGVLRRVRGLQYYQRPLSGQLQKQKALKRKQRRETFEELEKLGKLPERKKRRR